MPFNFFNKMLKEFVISVILDNLEHTPTEDQQSAVKVFSEFIYNYNERSLYLLHGYAGTGKTTLISSIVRSLNKFQHKCILLAPTGKAAKVISKYSGSEAFTIHKKIYRQKSFTDGYDTFSLNDNLHANTLFIVDEASMISNNSFENNIFGSGNLLNDLFEYVYNGKNCKLILIGDSAQLPPIGSVSSPALEHNLLENQYDAKVYYSSLKMVVRQSGNSGILQNATLIRHQIDSRIFDFPKLMPATDVQKLSGAELIDELASSYDSVGISETIVITRSNSRANKFNEGIRNSVLWREEQISVGDFVMIVKNNYQGYDDFPEISFLANGDVAEIERIKGYEEMYNLSFANVSIRFPDLKNLEIDKKILLDTLVSKSPALPSEENKKFYHAVAEDYSEIRNKKERYMKVKENEYFNALQVKFSYAVTCHKAQGGQWRHVYIDHGYLPDETFNLEMLRWLYTAMTRATEKVFLLNFDKRFFE